jgi:hypothetical protein
MLQMDVLPVLLMRLKDLVVLAESTAVKLAAEAAAAAEEAGRAALSAANINVDDDTDDAPMRLYSTRECRIATLAAEKAVDLASAPVSPPTGTFETSSLMVNLCAGPDGAAARAEARSGGAMLDLVKLLTAVCRNGGAPSVDDQGHDVIKPLGMLLRSLSLGADPLVMAGTVETVVRLVTLGGVRGLPETALTAVIWAVSNLARSGPVVQNYLRDAGALQWLIQVTQAMNEGGGELHDSGGGGGGESGEALYEQTLRGNDSGGGGGRESGEALYEQTVRGSDSGGGGSGVKAEVVAVLAAITNLSNGNPANQSRLRGERGLMEALTALVDDPQADAAACRAAQRALTALGSVLDSRQAKALGKP